MLLPKRVKYRRVQRGRMTGKATREMCIRDRRKDMSTKTNKLKTKDLIVAGAFAALYVVVLFAVVTVCLLYTSTCQQPR